VDSGKSLRMRRFFAKGRTVILPYDHALYYGPVAGIEDPRALTEIVAASDADGVLVTPGVLENVREVIGNLSVVLRMDGTHTRLGSKVTVIEPIITVENAVSIGADMGVLNVFPGAENESELLRKLGRAATECRRFGLPLMAEMLPISAVRTHYEKEKSSRKRGSVAEDIRLSARLGAEIGADIIKTHYTGTVASFKAVTSSAMAPVVVAGGPRRAGGDRGTLEIVREAMDAGACGICFGRNVWAHKNPAAMLAALCKIVHDDGSVETALKEIT